MKHLLIILSIMMIFCTAAHAEWEETFRDNYAEIGIQHAVTIALGEGHTPDQIIKTAIPLENLEREMLIKALFCALALPGSIYEAAEVNKIEDIKVAEGYQLALAECAREMEENLNVEFGPNNQLSPPSPSDRSRGSSQASPWNFQ